MFSYNSYKLNNNSFGTISQNIMTVLTQYALCSINHGHGSSFLKGKSTTVVQIVNSGIWCLNSKICGSPLIKLLPPGVFFTIFEPSTSGGSAFSSTLYYRYRAALCISCCIFNIAATHIAASFEFLRVHQTTLWASNSPNQQQRFANLEPKEHRLLSAVALQHLPFLSRSGANRPLQTP